MDVPEAAQATAGPIATRPEKPAKTAVLEWIAKLAVIYDLVLSSLLLVRWLAPVSSFDQIKAALSGGALGTFWMLGRPYFRKIADALGFRPHSVGALIRRLPTPAWYALVAFPLIPVLHLVYATLQPVELSSGEGRADWICDDRFHYKQPYLPTDDHVSQGANPIVQCLDAFAGRYERVSIRRGYWPAEGMRRLQLTVENGEVAFVAFPKRPGRQTIHLDDGRRRTPGSEVFGAQPGLSAINFDLDDPVFDTVEGMEIFVSLQGAEFAKVTLRAGLANSSDRRSIDATIQRVDK